MELTPEQLLLLPAFSREQAIIISNWIFCKDKVEHDSRYALYLKCDWWRKKRAIIWERAKNKCENCGSPAQATHHLSYARVARELDEDLIAICQKCHDTEHGRVGPTKQHIQNWNPVRPNGYSTTKWKTLSFAQRREVGNTWKAPRASKRDPKPLRKQPAIPSAQLKGRPKGYPRKEWINLSKGEQDALTKSGSSFVRLSTKETYDRMIAANPIAAETRAIRKADGTRKQIKEHPTDIRIRKGDGWIEHIKPHKRKQRPIRTKYVDPTIRH